MTNNQKRENPMSENDYIAEYVKEKYPKLIEGGDFLFWRAGRVINESLMNISEVLKKKMQIRESEDPEFEDDEEAADE